MIPRKSLFMVLLFCLLACWQGTGSAAEEVYQMSQQQLSQLTTDLQQLQVNNQQQQQLSTTQAQQLMTLQSQLDNSKQQLAVLQAQLQTSKVELQQAKTSLQQAQTSLQETLKSYEKYKRTVSDKHFGLGIGGGTINSKAIAMASIEYDNHNMGYEILGNKTDVIGLIKYRF